VRMAKRIDEHENARFKFRELDPFESNVVPDGRGWMIQRFLIT